MDWKTLLYVFCDTIKDKLCLNFRNSYKLVSYVSFRRSTDMLEGCGHVLFEGQTSISRVSNNYIYIYLTMFYVSSIQEVS